MKLYHGSNDLSLHKILKQGIRPRRSGEVGNFEGELASKAGYAYMTDTYAIYYAMNSLPDVLNERYEPKCVIYEIDSDLLEPDLFRPDEDYLRTVIEFNERLAVNDPMVHNWATADQLAGLLTPVKNFVSSLNLDVEEMKDYHKYSLLHGGTVAYRGVIPPEAITRYAVYDYKKIPCACLWGVAIEPMPQQFETYGKYARALIQLIMDGTPLEPIGRDPKLSLARDCPWANEPDRMRAIAERERYVKVVERRLPTAAYKMSLALA